MVAQTWKYLLWKKTRAFSWTQCMMRLPRTTKCTVMLHELIESLNPGVGGGGEGSSHGNFQTQTTYEEQSGCTQQRGTLTNWALFQRCLIDWWMPGNLCIRGSKEEKNDHTNYLQIFEGLSYEKFIMTFQDTEQGPLKTWGTLLNKVICLITKHQCSSQGLSNQKLDDQVQIL